jgi:hypothetical protein
LQYIIFQANIENLNGITKLKKSFETEIMMLSRRVDFSKYIFDFRPQSKTRKLIFNSFTHQWYRNTVEAILKKQSPVHTNSQKMLL